MGLSTTPYLQAVKGSRNLLLEFWDPSITRKRFKLETSNLAWILSMRCTNDKNSKLGQMRSGRGHVIYFWNFGTAFISRKPFKLETSDLAWIFIMKGTNDKNSKVGQIKTGRGHVTYLYNFGTPCISRGVQARNFRFGINIHHEGYWR